MLPPAFSTPSTLFLRCCLQLLLKKEDTPARRAALETRAQAVHLVRVELGGAEAEQKVEQAEVTVTAVAGERQTPQGWADTRRRG